MLRFRAASRSVVVIVTTAATAGCMALTPQLPPTDYEAIETVEDRDEREQIYAEEQVYRQDMPQGTRYTKGTDLSTPRSWQSLDAVLRSDVNSAAALPTKQLRRSRIFVALTVAAGILTVAGAAASAREGLNLGDIDPAGGVLLGGGLATVGFAIASGVFYGKSREGYERAVDIYNDSLGMRLGILDGKGNYVPPRGALIDAEGNVVLDPGERAGPEGPQGPLAAEPLREDASAPTEPASEDVVPPTEPEPEDVATPTEPQPEDVATPTEPRPEDVAAPTEPEPPAEAEPPAAEAVPEPGPPEAALRLQPRI